MIRGILCHKFYHEPLINKVLINGVYIANKSFDRYTLAGMGNTNTKTYSQIEKSRMAKLLLLIKRITQAKKIKITGNHKKIFNGYELLLPSTEYGYKALNEKSVITVMKNGINEMLTRRKRIGTLYRLPKLEKTGNGYYIEEKIRTEKYNPDDAVRFILLSQLESVIGMNHNGRIIQHNDLWRENILFDGTRFFIIDYEEVEENYFLYDFFTFIHSESVFYGDDSLLDNYFACKYDVLIKQLSKKYNIKYDAKDKMKYYDYFLDIRLEKKKKRLTRKKAIKYEESMNNSYREKYGRN